MRTALGVEDEKNCSWMCRIPGWMQIEILGVIVNSWGFRGLKQQTRRARVVDAEDWTISRID